MAIDTEERTSTSTPTPTQGTGSAPANAPTGAPAAKSNKKVITIVLVVVGVLVLLGIAGSIASTFLLKKGAESLIGAATGGAVEINTGSGDKADVKIKTKDGEITSGANQKMPADFPKSVPIYKADAKLVNVMTFNTNEKGKTFALYYELKDSPDKVFAFYEKELVTNGWEIVTSATSNSSSTIIAKNESKSQDVYVSVAEDNKGVTVLTINASPIKSN